MHGLFIQFVRIFVRLIGCLKCNCKQSVLLMKSGFGVNLKVSLIEEPFCLTDKEKFPFTRWTRLHSLQSRLMWIIAYILHVPLIFVSICLCLLADYCHYIASAACVIGFYGNFILISTGTPFLWRFCFCFCFRMNFEYLTTGLLATVNCCRFPSPRSPLYDLSISACK